jgi:hypothetical protein
VHDGGDGLLVRVADVPVDRQVHGQLTGRLEVAVDDLATQVDDGDVGRGHRGVGDPGGRDGDEVPGAHGDVPGGPDDEAVTDHPPGVGADGGPLGLEDHAQVPSRE